MEGKTTKRRSPNTIINEEPLLKKKTRHYSLLIVLALFIGSCDSFRVYEDYEDLDEAFWHEDSVKRFTFKIKETEKNYNIKATFRNARSYPFHNLYFKYTIVDSIGNVIVQELQETHFFDPKTGEPRGSGLGDLFDHSVLLMEDYHFDQPGSYTLQLQQFMRKDTLPFILSVGGRVEFSQQD